MMILRDIFIFCLVRKTQLISKYVCFLNDVTTRGLRTVEKVRYLKLEEAEKVWFNIGFLDTKLGLKCLFKGIRHLFHGFNSKGIA